MAVEITTYQIPDRGQDIEIYRDELLSMEVLALDFGRSKGLISWIQGRILLNAREACPRGKWGHFLASVNLKSGTASHLLRIGREITAENKNIEYNEMLAFSRFPSSVALTLRWRIGGITLARGSELYSSCTGESSSSCPSALASVGCGGRAGSVSRVHPCLLRRFLDLN